MWSFSVRSRAERIDCLVETKLRRRRRVLLRKILLTWAMLNNAIYVYDVMDIGLLFPRCFHDFPVPRPSDIRCIFRRFPFHRLPRLAINLLVVFLVDPAVLNAMNAALQERDMSRTGDDELKDD